MSGFEFIGAERPAAVNCFFGAISYCFNHSGVALSEADVFSLGKGYRLEVIIDEHGFPELSYPFYKTIGDMANALGVEVFTSHLDRYSPREQLEALLSQYGPLTVTVNTSYLPYLIDKYSKEGYTHAVALCEIVGGDVILEDFFIAAATPYSARVKVSFKSFIAAVDGAYIFKQYTEEGVYRYVKPVAGLAISDAVRLKNIVDTAVEMISRGGVADKIQQHFTTCCNISSSGGDIKKVMNLVVYDVTTDHVVPSRVLLRKNLENLGILTEQIDMLIKSAIEQWRLLATAARLSSRRSGNIQELQSRYYAVAEAENSLWFYISRLRVN